MLDTTQITCKNMQNTKSKKKKKTLINLEKLPSKTQNQKMTSGRKLVKNSVWITAVVTIKEGKTIKVGLL